MTTARKWIENYKYGHDDYRHILQKLPTFKTASYETYFTAFRTLLGDLDKLLKHSESIGFRKWRFTVYRCKQKTLDQMAKRVKGDSHNVCVGFGDWSAQNSPIKKKARGPVKTFKAVLQRTRGIHVIDIDEFRTSKRCSRCGEECENLRRKTKRSEHLRKVHQAVRCRNNECARSCGTGTRTRRATS